MTATNHVITGALVAAYVEHPFIAIPLAFLAHFAMDAIPHFRITAKNDMERFNQRAFKKLLMADTAVAVLLIVVIPLLLYGIRPWWLVVVCMMACASPDLAWGWRFFLALHKRIDKKKNTFSRLHSLIQWSETQSGIYVELAWFLAVSLLVLLKSRP